ncbi:MAG: hypothetical protein KKB25_02230, partial [Nanoarchaeota archaeon]|nr:hypothetical protein [Nanoarchaeota archaeon]
IFSWKAIKKLFQIALILFVIVAVSILIWRLLEQRQWWFVLGTVIAAMVFFRFTIVREGTAKSVMTLGKFSKILFQWEYHWMDEKWKILRENEKSEYEKKMSGLRIWGGLYFYGIWPINRIHRYKHRWTDIRIKETGKMELEFHEEELNHILLKPAVYAIQLFAVETAPPERIPVNVLVLITLRIENPYLFLFIAPPTPIEDVLARISASMRTIVTGCFLDDLLRLKGESLWMEEEKKEKPEEERPLLKGTKVIEDTLKKWGMKLADRGIEIKTIDLPPDYQKAAAAKKEQEMKSEGRAAEVVGTIKKSQEIIGNKEELSLGEIKELSLNKLAMENASYVKIDVQGAEGGIEKTILNSLAAWQRMPVGKPEEPKKEEKEEKTPEEEKPKKLTREEIRNEMEKVMKK